MLQELWAWPGATARWTLVHDQPPGVSSCSCAVSGVGFILPKWRLWDENLGLWIPVVRRRVCKMYELCGRIQLCRGCGNTTLERAAGQRCAFRCVHAHRPRGLYSAKVPLWGHRAKPSYPEQLCGSKPGLQDHTCVPWTCHFAETMYLFVKNRDVTAPGDWRWYFVCEKDGGQAPHTFNLLSFSWEASVIHNTITLFRNVSLDSISESLSRGIFKQSLDLCMWTCSS